MRMLVKGAGVAGLCLAHELSARGVAVTVVEQKPGFAGAASWFAGGMLAPWCERESAEEVVLTKGIGAIDWWDDALPGEVSRNGTLVVAPPRDAGELEALRFAPPAFRMARRRRDRTAGTGACRTFPRGAVFSR